jgi:SRSO17 transposase
MDKRFEIRRKELIEGALIKPEVYEDLISRLAIFLTPYVACLGRIEQKGHLKTYLQGLVSELERKNIEEIAYLHDQERHELQHFIGASKWAPEPFLDILTKQVQEDLGEEDGVLVVDPSGFEKDGKESVGVKRQWLGRLGKVDNGQVGVYAGYATRKGHALFDAKLYLPQEWAKDRVRRRKVGVPRSVRFRTKPQLAQDLIEKRGSQIPHRWVAGDDEMGRCTRFRAWLRERGERYVLAVPSNTGIRDLEAQAPMWSGHGAKPKTPFRSVSDWCQQLIPTAWTRIDVRDGEKGPLVVEIVKRRVQARTEKRRVGPEELLVITRSQESNGWKIDYHLSNAVAETSLEELARVVKAEHRIEDCIKRAKSEAGLADYEVRTWIGWYHHQILSLMATWFLTRECQRGEKMDTRHYGAADSIACCVVSA